MKFEADIITFLQAGMSDFWLYFFRIVTLFGSFIGFGLILMFIFFKNRRLSITFAFTYAFGVLLNKALKHIIMRPRPFVSYDTILNLGNVSSFSMPSGHACSAMIIGVFLAYYAIKFAKHKWTKVCVPIISVLYVMVICLSRMALGAHYLTDVLVGGIEGAIVALIGILIFNILRKKYGKTNEIKNSNQK